MKRTNQYLLMCTLISVSGTLASADIFTWIGGDGDWNDDSRWFGPVGQVPNSIVDSATLSGDQNVIVLNSNIALGTLNVLNGSDLLANGNSLFVSGDTRIDGDSTALSIRPSPTLNDFDTDSLIIKNGGFFILGGGATAQVDELVSIESGSVFLGTGSLEMNSTSGDLNIVSGVLWAQYSGSDIHTFTISRTQSSSSKLNWTHPESGVSVWPGIMMEVQIPFSGALGGSLSVSDSASFVTNEAIITGSNSQLKLLSSDTAFSNSSLLQAPVVDVYGSIRVNGYGTIETPILALRGQGEIVEDSVLRLDTTVTLFDSIEILSDGEGGRIEFTQSTGTLTVTGGTSLIDTGIGGHFDLDGWGNMEVSIQEDSSLVLEVEYIERFQSNLFDSVLNIEGELDVAPIGQGSSWTNSTGTINLDGGEIEGRLFYNESLLQGNGSVGSITLNRGTIISEGSTIYFDRLVLGGSTIEHRGIVYAQDGDISSAFNSGGSQFFGGDMFIGDGNDAREVLELNDGVIFSGIDGTPSTLSLNSGRLRGKRITLSVDSELDSQGVSQIRASGSSDTDWVRFEELSTSSIDDTLQIDGHSMIEEGAVFLGDGQLHFVNSSKTMTLSNGSDLADISIINHGSLAIDDYFEGVGIVNIASLSLENTSRLEIDLAGENNGVEHDQLEILNTATLNGILKLSTVEGYSVSFGDQITILSADSVIGQFSSLDYSGLEIGQSAEIIMFEDHVDVLITCRADLHQNGQLNFFDVSAFLSAFAMNDPIADFTNDGAFNFFDVSAFLQSYNAGCP